MPTEEPIVALLREVVSSHERGDARMQAAEKSLDELRHEMRRNTEVTETVKAAFERIAKAEEERNVILRESAEKRNKWMEKLWGSTAVQMLLSGIVVAFLNVLGVAYVTQQRHDETAEQPAPALQPPLGAAPEGDVIAP